MVFTAGNHRVQRDPRGCDWQVVFVKNAAREPVTATINDKRQVAVFFGSRTETQYSKILRRRGVNLQPSGRKSLETKVTGCVACNCPRRIVGIEAIDCQREVRDWRVLGVNYRALDIDELQPVEPDYERYRQAVQGKTIQAVTRVLGKRLGK